MMALNQALSAFGALAFFGTMALLVVAIAAVIGVRLIGERRLSRCVEWCSLRLFGGRGLAWKISAVTIVVLGGYFAVLFTTLLASHKFVLAPGEQKYFCEIDCHLAYSVVSVAKEKSIGSGPNAAMAEDTFYVVTIRTWFDQRTISQHRGDFPLEPSPRAITLVDGNGNQYSVAMAGQDALENNGGAGTPLTQPLRPGESYVSRLVFDVPAGARDLRMLVASHTEPKWLGRMVIGDEDSFLHK